MAQSVRKRPQKPRPPRRPASGGVVGPGSLGDRFGAYIRNHAQAFISSLGRLTRTPFATAMTIVVLAIAVSLPATLYLLVSNAQQAAGKLEAGDQVSLFLKVDVSDEGARKLAGRLSNNPGIKTVTVITKAEALEEFRQYSGFGDALMALGDNPLPAVVQVSPKQERSTAAIETLLSELQKQPEVDMAQFDLQWVKRLQSMMIIAQRVIGLLAFLLGMGVILIVGNTIRLELQSRRDEVMVSKLVGATNAFIRRPFVYGGFWYGLLGGILAWIIVAGMLLLLKTPVENLSILYDSGYQLLFLGWRESLILIFGSALLGVAGAWLTLLGHLRRLNPE